MAHLKKKAFKTKEQAETHRLLLCEQLGVSTIECHPIKSTTVEKYGLTMYSFNNTAIKSRQGAHFRKGTVRIPNAMELRYPDKEPKTVKLTDTVNYLDDQIGPIVLIPGTKVAITRA